ncbi:MAG TPA: hypothetical protein VI564_07850 [Candidatus Nanoarchaeia archaeon]|nr:hypothetical protein [Candidatus Nanoarchaeia archaeon]
MDGRRLRLIERLSPLRKGLERNVSLDESEILNIHPCGEIRKGCPVYCIWTKEDVILYYLRQNGQLNYAGTDVNFKRYRK